MALRDGADLAFYIVSRSALSPFDTACRGIRGRSGSRDHAGRSYLPQSQQKPIQQGHARRRLSGNQDYLDQARSASSRTRSGSVEALVGQVDLEAFGELSD